MTDEPKKPDASKGRRKRDILKQYAVETFFVLYYSLGPERSLEGAVRRAAEIGLKTPHLNTIKNWSAQYGWVKKIEEMDQRVRDAALNDTAKAIAAMNERQTLAAMMMQQAVVEDLSAHIKLRRADKMEPMRPGEMATLWDRAVKWERQIKGQATERIEITNTVLTTFVLRIVQIFQRVNQLEDPEQRASEFADAADEAVDHLLSVEGKG